MKLVPSCLCVGFFLFAGCHKPPEPPDVSVLPSVPTAPVSLAGPPDLLADSEEGFADFSFFISDVRKTKEGTLLVAEATYAGKPAKIAVVLSGVWEVRESESPVPLRGGNVAFQSLGAESDNFLAAMSKGYEIASQAKTMPNQIHALGLSLEGNPANVEKEACKIKIFFNEEGGDDYCEAFCNVDIAQKRLTFAEKDTSYRKALWRCFAGQAKTTFRPAEGEPVRVYSTPVEKK